MEIYIHMYMNMYKYIKNIKKTKTRKIFKKLLRFELKIL